MPVTTGLHADAEGAAVHRPYRWVVANETAREALSVTAGDVYKVALQLDDGSVWTLTDDSPMTWVQVGSGGSGGGAPTDAAYVTTAANNDLDAELVIPGLAGSPDRAGAGGGGTSREFTTGDTAPTWTPSAPATTDMGTTIPSHYYWRSPDTTERLAYWAWSPGSGAFDARCKLSLGSDQGAADCGSGLVVMNSDNSVRALASHAISGRVASMAAYSYSGSYTGRGSVWSNVPSPLYLRISRDGSNNVSWWWSANGLAWNLIATLSFSITVARIGFRSDSGGHETAVDWLRTSV